MTMESLHEAWLTMGRAFLAAALLATVPAALGVYVVLRRVVFVGIALAEFSAVGIALALSFALPPGLLAPAFALGGVLLLSQAAGRSVLPRDSIVGLSYVTAGAAAILVLKHFGQASGEELKALMWGSLIFADAADVKLLALALAVAGLPLALFSRQLLFTGFDPEMAAASGYRVRWWDLLFFGVLGLVAAAATRVAGVLVTFGFLVLPAAAALQLARSLRRAVILAVVFGLLSAALGSLLSLQLDSPTGPMIVACSFVLFALASLVRLIARIS